MYLTRIELQGFKSFAKRTVFEFPEKSSHDKNAKSITSIVGPNGSGKSNVADAARWVLGEQSLKLVRCKKADDVIFSGSEKKARQGFAEVSLYINNEDKELPIDYTEVVLTRRVYRNGETEYLINKSKVRLFDLLILLAKANFGQKTYSIIGQGMVDHIINISPFERKEFFDEATGVKQYQIKRDQAVNRLRRSRDNLNQTNQIIAELEPRMRSLNRQIKKLEKRKELEKQLREMQKKYYGHIWRNLQKDRFQYSEMFNIKDALKKDLELKLEGIKTELAKLAKAESRKDIFNDLQKEHNKLINEKNEMLKELAVIKGKMSLEYVKFGKQNLTWLEDKKEEVEKRIKEINESLNNLRIRLEHKQEILGEKENKDDKITKELVILSNNLEAVQDELAKIKSKDKSEDDLESVKAILRQKDNIKGIYGTASELAKIESQYEAALTAAAASRLSAIVVQNDGTAEKCINYLKENKLGPVVFIPLNKLAVESAKREAKKLLAEKGAIALAVDLISFEPKFKKVFQLIFGNTIVVDNFESAKDIGIGKTRMVTLDGDILEKNWLIKAGYRKKGILSWLVLSEEKKLASQEEKLKEIALLKSKIGDFIKQKEILNSEINELKIEIQVGETKNKGLINDFESLKKEKDKIEAEIQENKISPKDQDGYLKNLNSKKQEIERGVDNLEEKIAGLRSKIDKFNLEEEKKKSELFNLQTEMQRLQAKLNEANNEINEINISLAKLETKKEDLEKEIKQETGVEIDCRDKTLFWPVAKEEVVNIDQLWFEVSKLKGNLELIGGIDPEIVDEHKEVAERYEFLNKQILDLEKAIRDLEKIVKELDEMIDKQFDGSFKKINKAFVKYFVKIFGGGKAKLELIQKVPRQSSGQEGLEGEDAYIRPQSIEISEGEVLAEKQSRLVNTGIEIMVAPPNKKIHNITALSGGERTMTSLALICAIIDSNPAPFIVMDEVDAALDEVNSEKFSAILQELSYKSQFIIITHNRVVMHVADVLYGVAMGDDGVSKVLSLRLEEMGGIKK